MYAPVVRIIASAAAVGYDHCQGKTMVQQRETGKIQGDNRNLRHRRVLRYNLNFLRLLSCSEFSATSNQQPTLRKCVSLSRYIHDPTGQTFNLNQNEPHQKNVQYGNSHLMRWKRCHLPLCFRGLALRSVGFDGRPCIDNIQHNNNRSDVRKRTKQHRIVSGQPRTTEETFVVNGALMHMSNHGRV